MEPILPVGIERSGMADRPGTIRNLMQGLGETGPTNQMPHNLAIQSVSSLEIGSNVQQLLQTIGSGTQSNKMLELMITLLILMSMLEQQQSAKSSDSLLSSLGGLSSSRSTHSASFSMTTLTVQSSSFSIMQFNASQGCPSDPGSSATPRLDTIG